MAAPVASEVKPEFEEAHKEHASVARGVDIKEAGELPTVSSDLQGERQPFLKRLFAPKKRPSYLLRSKVAEMEKLYGHNPELQALASILIDEVDTLSDSTAAFCSQGVTPLANAYTTLAESSLKLSKRPLAKGIALPDEMESNAVQRLGDVLSFSALVGELAEEERTVAGALEALAREAASSLTSLQAEMAKDWSVIAGVLNVHEHAWQEKHKHECHLRTLMDKPAELLGREKNLSAVKSVQAEHDNAKAALNKSSETVNEMISEFVTKNQPKAHEALRSFIRSRAIVMKNAATLADKPLAFELDSAAALQHAHLTRRKAGSVDDGPAEATTTTSASAS